jgi:hypothetical protein
MRGLVSLSDPIAPSNGMDAESSAGHCQENGLLDRRGSA